MTTDFFYTWKIFKDPENLRKLGYAIVIFVAITILVSIICGIVSFSDNKEENRCTAVPPQCAEKIFNCENLENGWSLFGLVCLTEKCRKKDTCFAIQKRDQEMSKLCQKGFYDECVQKSVDAGIDSALNVALYSLVALVSILVLIFLAIPLIEIIVVFVAIPLIKFIVFSVAIPLVKGGGSLAIEGTKASASMANQVIRDRIKYGDGFDYQFHKLLLALQIKILKKVGPISDSQMTVMQMLYEKCGYKTDEFHSRFTQLLSDEGNLDFSIKNIRIAILGRNELKVSVIESLLTFIIACGYNESIEFYIRYVADNLGLDKDVYIIIRDSMLKYANKTAYNDLDNLFFDLELNQFFTKKEMVQLSKMDLEKAPSSMNSVYSKEYFRFVFPLLVKLSYADGALGFERINVLNNFYSDCGYTKSDFLRLFKSYLADGHSFYFHIMNLKENTRKQKEFRIHALEDIVLFASLINLPQPQFDMIESMSKDLDVSENSFATVKNKFSLQSNDQIALIASLRSVNKHLFS